MSTSSINILTIEPDLDWKDLGACRGTFNPYFFPEQGHHEQERAAKAVCRTCVVVLECLEWALEIRPAYGVFGAKNPKERRRMIQTRRRESGRA